VERRMNLELKRKILAKVTTDLNTAKDIFDLFRLLNYPEENLFDIDSKRKKTDFDF
jgi:hypothetical protein